MKRSVINRAYHDAAACLARHHWTLPPNAKWDITDFGLGDFDRFGLTLINLTTEPEYCEKIMYARRGQTTPCHAHEKKKEDIICRAGELSVTLWQTPPKSKTPLGAAFSVPVDGNAQSVLPGVPFSLRGGSRVTLAPGIWHEFVAVSDECIIGEVSTANDDLHDNLFVDPAIGRFPGIKEDEPAAVRLISEK